MRIARTILLGSLSAAAAREARIARPFCRTSRMAGVVPGLDRRDSTSSTRRKLQTEPKHRPLELRAPGLRPGLQTAKPAELSQGGKDIGQGGGSGNRPRPPARRKALTLWHAARCQSSAAQKAAEVVGVPGSTHFSWVKLRQNRLEPWSPEVPAPAAGAGQGMIPRLRGCPL